MSQPPKMDARPGVNTPDIGPLDGAATEPRGLSIANPFAESLSNDDQRISRVENVVLELKRDFESLKPSILRLVAVEADLQDLIGQLDALLQSESNTPAPQPVGAPQPLTQNAAPATTTAAINTQPSPPAPQPEPAPSPKPSASSASVAVTSFRTGEHSDKVRLVMDVNAKTSFSLDLDNQERLLIIELPNASWNTAKEQSFARSPLLQSYNVETLDNGGSRVIMTLKKDTSILKQQALPPGENPNHRIYFDLKL